jgi:hypothetical protein
VAPIARRSPTHFATQAREIKVLRTADVGEKMLGAVTEALREPLADVLGEVWKQRKEMREIAAKGAEPHDVEGDVELIKHTVTWGLHPTIRLELNGQDVGKVDLDVDISLKIEGVQLVIKNARITKIKTGALTSTVALKWKGLPLGAPRTRTISLPGELALPHKGDRPVSRRLTCSAGGVDLRRLTCAFRSSRW